MSKQFESQLLELLSEYASEQYDGGMNTPNTGLGLHGFLEWLKEKEASREAGEV